MRRSLIRFVFALVLGVGAVQPAAAAEGYGSQFGWGMATIVANAFYIPAKLVYATIGGVTGGLAYVLTIGNSKAVEGIWSPSLGGTYVLSPEMLRGDQPVLFSGESYDCVDCPHSNRASSISGSSVWSR